MSIHVHAQHKLPRISVRCVNICSYCLQRLVCCFYLFILGWPSLGCFIKLPQLIDRLHMNPASFPQKSKSDDINFLFDFGIKYQQNVATQWSLLVKNFFFSSFLYGSHVVMLNICKVNGKIPFNSAAVVFFIELTKVKTYSL